MTTPSPGDRTAALSPEAKNDAVDAINLLHTGRGWNAPVRWWAEELRDAVCGAVIPHLQDAERERTARLAALLLRRDATEVLTRMAEDAIVTVKSAGDEDSERKYLAVLSALEDQKQAARGERP